MKKYRLAVLPLLVIALASFQGCYFRYTGSDYTGQGRFSDRGPVVNHVVKVKDFDKINLQGVVSELRYEYTDGEPYVEIDCTDSLYKYLDISVNDRELEFRLTKRRASSSATAGVIVKAYSHSLSGLNTAGSPDVWLPDIKCEGFELGVAGSGNVEVRSIDAGESEVSLHVAGSGDIDCESIACGKMSVGIAGSADIEADYIKSTSLEISISGSGDFTMGAGDCGDVEASIAGSGDISLSGYANSIQSKVNGSGELDTSSLKIRK